MFSKIVCAFESESVQFLFFPSALVISQKQCNFPRFKKKSSSNGLIVLESVCAVHLWFMGIIKIVYQNIVVRCLLRFVTKLLDLLYFFLFSFYTLLRRLSLLFCLWMANFILYCFCCHFEIINDTVNHWSDAVKWWFQLIGCACQQIWTWP